jgi:serine/threonine protein phosphatase PrpC
MYVTFKAVWDGHGGMAASEYCSENVERFLDRHLETEERRQSAVEGGNGRFVQVLCLEINYRRTSLNAVFLSANSRM